MLSLSVVEKPTYEEFVGYLRSALHYLYDTVHLRRSPLVHLLGLSGEFDTGTALQRTLTNAIRALKPPDDEPPQSNAWGIHDTLSLHYIRQFTRDVVAMQLGISERQLRREQRLALEVLAQRLWQDLSSAPSSSPSPPLVTTQQPGSEYDQALSDELVWLRSPTEEQHVPLSDILHTVQTLVQPLALQWRVPLRIHVEPGLEDIPLLEMVTHNILLTILSMTIPAASPGEVILSAARRASHIEFTIVAAATGTARGLDENSPGMKTARQLASFYGASLAVQTRLPGIAVTLTLPATEQIPVLIIDDNADWDAMLKRYAVGSRYHVVGTQDPQTAIGLAEKTQPAVIFLDVMMPKFDGWQVLSELRQEQATSHIPIVVCTVLPLEGLALSLGVNAFLQKPVTQDQFLGILDKLTANPE
jgi:CheY-like chemotaxis protein